MASDPITGLPPAAAVSGSDPIVTVQSGVTVQSDYDAMKAFIDASPTMTFKGQADASAVDEDAATGTSTFQNGDVYRINVAASAPHAFSDISEDLLIGDWVVFNGSIFQKQDGTDPTAAETKTAYRSNADTNAFDDAAVSKLGGIEALANVTDTANVTAAGALMDSEVDADLKTLALPANTTISIFGASLVDDADAPTARTTLDVDQAGTDNSTDVTLAGALNYITISGQEITRNAIDLTTDITGDLPVADGGTGASTDSAARTNLGLVIGADVQAWDAVLDATTASFTTAAETKLSGIEALADVTDTANVDAAGAVMETDFNAQTVLLAVANDTPLPITINASEFVGRKATGDVGTMTAAESRTVLNVEDGSTSDQTDVEIKTAYENNPDTNEFSDFEQTKLNDINDRGFNIQTAFFDGNSFSTAGEDTGPAGFAYNNDGTRLWLAGGVTDTIYEYDLGTPYRPSTAVFNSVSLSIAAQETSVSGITISPDGTKFFICGSSGDEVNQYSFGSAFSLTGASFDSVTVSVSAQSTIPRGLQFNPDGSKLFIAELTGTVFQYTVTSGGHDLSGGIVFDSVSLITSTEDNVANGLVFKEGGRKLYIPGAQNDKVYQYDLPTPYILTGGQFDNISFDVSSEDTQPVEVLFDPNGSNMAIIGNDTDAFYEYELDSDGIFTDAEKLKLANIAYAKRTASAKQTITGGGALTLAHNLSGTPTLWYVILENKEVEHNFSPGDQTRPSAVQSGSGDQGVGITPDGSDLNIRYGSGFGGGSSVFSVVDQTTGDVEIITNSKWEAIFVAAL